MSGLSRRRRTAGARPAAAAAAVTLMGVVTKPAALPAALGGVAAGLRGAGGAATVVVATVGQPVRTAFPLPRARSLARRLGERGFEALATGAVCHVTLPEEAAATEFRRLLVAAGVPVVLGVTSRCAELDVILAAADRLVLALPVETDPALAALAAASLRDLGPPVQCRRVPMHALGRPAAALGLRALAPVEVESRPLDGQRVPGASPVSEAAP